MKKNKLCFISSSGGHFSQLKQIYNNFDDHVFSIVTERTDITTEGEYLLRQQDRKKIYFFIVLLHNLILSICFFLKIKPKVVISTGAGVVIPFCIIAKLFGAKVIFIESFAKINTPTLTGKIIYKFADRFYYQWEEMSIHYPKGIFRGQIY